MECISTFLTVHTVYCCDWLIVITVRLIVTVFTAITVFSYWRCCSLLSSDCLICKVNHHFNRDVRQKYFILKRVARKGGGLRLFENCVEFKNYIIKLYR